jgi:hypothetical protein
MSLFLAAQAPKATVSTPVPVPRYLTRAVGDFPVMAVWHGPELRMPPAVAATLVRYPLSDCGVNSIKVESWIRGGATRPTRNKRVQLPCPRASSPFAPAQKVPVEWVGRKTVAPCYSSQPTNLCIAFVLFATTFYLPLKGSTKHLRNPTLSAYRLCVSAKEPSTMALREFKAPVSYDKQQSEYRLEPLSAQSLHVLQR